jgi:DNA-binding IclR family transcriptional regulator
MDRYNQLKLRVLSALASGEWARPVDVARRVDFFPSRSAWTYLKRLSSFGLLERQTFGKGTLHYRISEGGLQRLRWLRSGQR